MHCGRHPERNPGEKSVYNFGRNFDFQANISIIFEVSPDTGMCSSGVVVDN